VPCTGSGLSSGGGFILAIEDLKLPGMVKDRHREAAALGARLGLPGLRYKPRSRSEGGQEPPSGWSSRPDGASGAFCRTSRPWSGRGWPLSQDNGETGLSEAGRQIRLCLSRLSLMEREFTIRTLVYQTDSG